MIELFQVSKCFNAGRPNQFLALDNISLTIRRQELTVLKGPSGSGKTTLLSLVGCMSRPTSGRIHLTGMSTAFMKNAAAAEQSRYLQSPGAVPDRNQEATVRLHLSAVQSAARHNRAGKHHAPCLSDRGEPPTSSGSGPCELLETFAIARHAESKVEWLSGGELQRVAIARALINDPEVIIADEPTAHLDSRLSAEFMAIVGAFRQDGKSIIIASHDPIVFSHPLADTVITMRDGRVVADPAA